MDTLYTVCLWVSELVPLFATLISFIYGIMHFFKKGKAVYLQIITIAMGCFALGNLHHLCQTMLFEEVFEGFTPSYLGHIGFFLFLITSNYGQIDGIVDDRSPATKKSRYIALCGPALAIILYIPNYLMEMPVSTKITYATVWIAASVSIYYNLKHAIIPDMGFGFIKAIRPYNIMAVLVSCVDLLYLTSWSYYDYRFGCIAILITSVVFSVFCIIMMRALKEGVKKWTI